MAYEIAFLWYGILNSSQLKNTENMLNGMTLLSFELIFVIFENKLCSSLQGYCCQHILKTT